MNSENEISRLKAFMEGEEKYNIVPVPTPLERAAALDFATGELEIPEHSSSAEAVKKLSRLAVFYDLVETAGEFVSILAQPEAEPSDFARSAAAVEAVAWLGSEEQIAKAQAHFISMVRRADIEASEEPLLDAADALGLRVNAETFREAVGAVVSSLKQEQSVRRKAGAPEEELDRLEDRISRLEEFAEVACREIDEANAVRKATAALEEQARIVRLAELYLDDSEESTARLAKWAALTLLREKERFRVAAAFTALAGQYEKSDPAIQDEIDAVRARALRAAEFFGEDPAPAQREWLAKKTDEGTDLLVLRKSWKYPLIMER